MQHSISGVTIEVVQGDIASQDDVEAVVNAANSQLRTGGGVAGALHRAAGPKMAEEARPMAPIEPGQAVITGGYNLPNEHVIHCLGPVYGEDKPEADLLAQCYEKALDLADEHGVRSVAFPALSTGAFGYPMEEATEIALKTVLAKAYSLEFVELIRFVLFDDAGRDTYERLLKEMGTKGA